MKYHILHDFRTSAPLKAKSSRHSKGLHKLKLLTNVDVKLTSFLGRVINYVLQRFSKLCENWGGDVVTSKF